MIRSLFANLRVRFLLLVLLAVLPALGLLILSASEQRDQAVTIERKNAGQRADLLAADQGRAIESTRQLLTVLAELPEIRTAGPECDKLLEGLVEEFPQYANLGVVARDGSVACSGLAPPNSIDLGDRPDIRGVFETSEFTVGEYATDAVTGLPVLNAAYPVPGEDETVNAVVYAALDLADFSEFAAASEVSEEAIVTLLDRNGTVLARQPEGEIAVGQSLAADPIFQTIRAQGNGVTEGQIGDRSYLFAFATLSGESVGNAYLSIARPRSEILEEPDKAFSRNLTRLGLVVVVVMVAAWVGGDLLARRSADAHKELVRRIYDAFATGSVDLLDDVVDQGFVDHDPMPGQAPGLPGLKQAVGLFRAGFPDGKMIINELVAEGDKVVARVTLNGTHTGEYFGRKGTGQTVTADGIEVFRVSGDKVCEGWSRFVLPEEGLIEHGHDGARATPPPYDVNGFTPVAEDDDVGTATRHDSRVRDT